MKVYNGLYEKYAAEKIKETVLDNYKKTGERHTHIKLDNSEEKKIFMEEAARLDDRFGVELVASLIYTVSYVGD